MRWCDLTRLCAVFGVLLACSSNDEGAGAGGAGFAGSGGAPNSGGAGTPLAGSAGASTAGAATGGREETSDADVTGDPSGGGGVGPSGAGGGPIADADVAADAPATADARGGGSAGGSAGGGGSDAGTAGPGCAGLLLCDDFETYAADQAPNGRWTTQARGSAKAVIDTSKAYSGSKSVHFTGTVNQSSANIVTKGAPVFPVQGNTVFVRMMMFVQSYPATSGVHTRLARLGTSTNGLDGSGYALTTYNGTGVERINEAMVRDTSLHLTDANVKGRWVCWEWELDNTAGPPAGGKGKVLARLWRDDAPVTLGGTSHTSLAWDPVAWQVLELGLEAYQTDSQPGDFWIDDVAMNTQKIGCPNK